MLSRTVTRREKLELSINRDKFPTLRSFVTIWELEQGSRCSGLATEWAVTDLNTNKGKRIFFSPKRPDRLLGPPSLLFNVYYGYVLELKWLGREVDSSVRLVATLRMSGAIPLLFLYALMDGDQFAFAFLNSTTC